MEFILARLFGENMTDLEPYLWGVFVGVLMSFACWFGTILGARNRWKR